MRKLAIIGCGGINSWVVKHLYDVITLFDKKELIFVKLFDKDVIEEKNLLRFNQNFEIDDLMMEKAETLAKRYSFDFENIFITEENLSLLDNFTDIILGVDNHKIRKLLYEYCLKKGKYLLDLRAQGTQMAFYILDHKRGMEYYNKLHFNNEEIMNKKGSCQLKTDVENDHIENANKIIAFYGIYGIYFKHLRGEDVAKDEWKEVY